MNLIQLKYVLKQNIVNRIQVERNIHERSFEPNIQVYIFVHYNVARLSLLYATLFCVCDNGAHNNDHTQTRCAHLTHARANSEVLFGSTGPGQHLYRATIVAATMN